MPLLCGYSLLHICLLLYVNAKGAPVFIKCVHMDVNNLFMIRFLEHPVPVFEYANTIKNPNMLAGVLSKKIMYTGNMNNLISLC